MNVKGYGGTLPALPGEEEEYSDNHCPGQNSNLELPKTKSDVSLLSRFDGETIFALKYD
jgi:hypothetical protein